MANTPKARKISKDDLFAALESLREELRVDFQEISRSAQREPSGDSGNGSEVADAVQMLRTDLRTEIEYLSKLLTKKSAELTTAQSQGLDRLQKDLAALEGKAISKADDTEVSEKIAKMHDELRQAVNSLSELVERSHEVAQPAPSESPEMPVAIQSLQSEVRTGVDGLSQAIEALRKPRSRFASILLVLVSLTVGAAGSALYFRPTGTGSQPQSQDLAAVATQIDTALASHAATLSQQTDALKSVVEQMHQEKQDTALASQDVIDRRSTESAALPSDFNDREDRPDEKTEVARPQLPEAAHSNTATDHTATPETATPETATPETASKGPVEAAKPGDPPASEAAEGEVAESPAESSVLIGRIAIDNAAPFAIKLRINGVLVNVKASGTTTVPAHVGKMRVQIGETPETTKSFNDWKVVDGKQQLTIQIGYRDDQYWLR